MSTTSKTEYKSLFKYTLRRIEGNRKVCYSLRYVLPTATVVYFRKRRLEDV